MVATDTMTEVEEQQKHFLTFRLDYQIYGLPLEAIAQITPMVTIKPVPELSALVMGVINVRGKLVPVIDMQHHLKLPPIRLHLHTPILLTNYADRTVGLIVKDVLDIVSLAEEDIISPESILPEELAGAPILRGLINTNGNMVTILDVNHIFSMHQRDILAQTASVLSEIDIDIEEASQTSNDEAPLSDEPLETETE